MPADGTPFDDVRGRDGLHDAGPYLEADVPFLVDLLECLQAVGGKSRALDMHLLDAMLSTGLEGFIGIGLQPGLRTKARLERDLPLASINT